MTGPDGWFHEDKDVGRVPNELNSINQSTALPMTISQIHLDPEEDLPRSDNPNRYLSLASCKAQEQFPQSADVCFGRSDVADGDPDRVAPSQLGMREKELPSVIDRP